DRAAREDEGVSPALGYGRGGFSTKIHLVTDGNGLPMGALLTAGQRHESAFFTDVMDQVRVPRPTGRPRKRPEAA
ncbi:transposase, partial [Salinibacter ruber]|uniref:transposase n=1 Tax=Salinibacter ruber TaxID=146919 RepID=UPI001614F9E9